MILKIQEDFTKYEALKSHLDQLYPAYKIDKFYIDETGNVEITMDRITFFEHLGNERGGCSIETLHMTCTIKKVLNNKGKIKQQKWIINGDI